LANELAEWEEVREPGVERLGDGACLPGPCAGVGRERRMEDPAEEKFIYSKTVLVGLISMDFESEV
jgi:hypothetical protein